MYPGLKREDILACVGYATENNIPSHQKIHKKRVTLIFKMTLYFFVSGINIAR